MIRLRYPARCVVCGTSLSKGGKAAWDREKRAATCARCLDPERIEVHIDRGEAGASARREWQRRHAGRERKVRQSYGPLGGLVLALTEDPQATRAWAQGAQGERLLGSLLDPLRAEGMAVLHDRRIPGSRANIDHVVVSRAGIFVIDAKNYSGRVDLRDRGGWFSTDWRLYVGRRDCTRLVRGMAKQIDAVRAVLAPDLIEVPVTPAICFVDSDWPLFSRPLKFGNVHIVWPRALAKLLRAEGGLSATEITTLERRIALALTAVR